MSKLPASFHTGPSLEVRLRWEDGEEQVIGWASGLQFTVHQGQKMIFTVDSPIPAEIASAAAPSFIQGSMTLYLPKGTTLENSGLVPRMISPTGTDIAGTYTKTASVMVYNRESNELVIGVQGFKVGVYSFNMSVRSHVMISLQFAGTHIKEGISY